MDLTDQHNEESSRVDSSARGLWQFSLTDLFVLTTWCAVAAGIATAFGPRTLLTTLGLSLAGLNCRGAFAILQEGRRQAAMLGAAWGLFLFSLCLPCMPGIFGTQEIRGYEAAWFTFTAPFHAVRDPSRLIHPTTPWVLLMDAANVLVLILPVLIWRWRFDRTQAFGPVLCVSMVSTWSVGSEPKMLVGYYVWCLSFYFALVALKIKLRTLAAMAGVALILGIMLAWEQLRL